MQCANKIEANRCKNAIRFERKSHLRITAKRGSSIRGSRDIDRFREVVFGTVRIFFLLIL